ncbi:hypothetical protein HPP92_026055 [Vanilla planifolia]|uniref:Uncharacterized protein n=1 Tax=Vanilla planifolia TaxID=51239 RepID=A0A835UAJ4_VANPL|nr:hypothetical protein HPP92_026055 [Vanilla planifolia]
MLGLRNGRGEQRRLEGLSSCVGWIGLGSTDGIIWNWTGMEGGSGKFIRNGSTAADQVGQAGDESAAGKGEY